MNRRGFLGAIAGAIGLAKLWPAADAMPSIYPPSQHIGWGYIDGKWAQIPYRIPKQVIEVSDDGETWGPWIAGEDIPGGGVYLRDGKVYGVPRG